MTETAPEPSIPSTLDPALPAPVAFPPLEPVTTEASTGQLTPVSFLIAVLVAFVAALLVGWLWHWVSSRFFDTFYLPLFVGVAAGWVAGRLLRVMRLRGEAVGIVCGLLAGILTMGMRHTWDSYAERPEMIAGVSREIAARKPDWDRATVQTAAEEVLTPLYTVRLHLETQSKYGSYIRTTDPKMIMRRRTLWRGGWFWAGLVGGTAVMGIAGLVTAGLITGARACPECGKPLKENLLFRRHSDQADDVLACAERQDWNGLMSLPKADRIDPKNVTDVLLHRCEAGGCPATLCVETQSSSVKRKQLLRAWISSESANAARAASMAEPI